MYTYEPAPTISRRLIYCVLLCIIKEHYCARKLVKLSSTTAHNEKEKIRASTSATAFNNKSSMLLLYKVLASSNYRHNL